MGLGWSQAKPTGMLRRRRSKIFMENVNKTRLTRPCSFFFLSLDVVLTISTPENLSTSQEDLLSHLTVKLMDKDNFS